VKKYILFLFFLFSLDSFSQNTLSGKVTDDKNNPLIGANVFISEINFGVVTDENGFYFIELENISPPYTLNASYIGYKKSSINVVKGKSKIDFVLDSDQKVLNELVIYNERLVDKQKQSPLTIESMDLISIKETPSYSFYEGLGSLKGVDLTSASLAFKVINTRGFNSTSPVRSLQLIDGVDNQAPGLNFALGNFLGASDLDVMKVEIIQGASSAYYGPGAFNGVINITTKDPFLYPGLSVQTKYGERNLFDNSIRYAKNFNDKIAVKFNFSYLKADDWEANNYSLVEDNNNVKVNNPGGYDAVNVYGDEDIGGNLNDLVTDINSYFDYPGLGIIYRNGYQERDVVDYNTKNIKASSSLHYKFSDESQLLYGINYGGGTTVYQGDNRINLKNIRLVQNRFEYFQKDKFKITYYNSVEDAGDSYDAVFTAQKLQEYNLIFNDDWYKIFKSVWRDNVNWNDFGIDIDRSIEFELDPTTGLPIIDPVTNLPIFSIVYLIDGVSYNENDFRAITDSIFNSNIDFILNNHEFVRSLTNDSTDRLIPGSDQFNEYLENITTSIPINGGTGFYDKSMLHEINGYYNYKISIGDLRVGTSFRQYRPNSKGTIFNDEFEKITNNQFGLYSGIESKIYNEIITINSTIRLDKNENYDYSISPAASIVISPNERDYIRLSFSSGVRNPTLSEQYLYYNAGRAILVGNLNGHGVEYGENLVTINSLVNYFKPVVPNKDSLVFFSIDPIRPEKVRTFEFGYRGTVKDILYLDLSYYYSLYKDFIGYRVGAKFNANDTIVNGVVGYDLNARSIEINRMSANSDNNVSTHGASIGMNVYLNKYLINGNYSLNILNKKNTDDPIIPAYNTPKHKFNIGFSARQLKFKNIKGISFNINYKWVDKFKFVGSPQFTGTVDRYSTVDAQLSKNFEIINTTIKFGASNIFDKKHYQVYGGPLIGRLSYVSLAYDL
tara:strand:+ start:30890 stop:33751 length:2862 start_codon:yes stop_codon:yes gene_type:complete